jgi:hypothetical protein
MIRAPVEDFIITEVMQGGDRCLWKNIYLFILYVWEKQQMPEEWKTAIIRPTFLKGNKLECENN